MNTVTSALAGTVAAGAATLAYASLIERNAFTVRHFSVPVLPAGSSPLRVLCLSDMHLVPGQERKIAWVRSLAELEPDFVVNTGDNLSDIDAVPHALRAMEPLLKRPGVFVLGSNDYFAPKPKNPFLYLTPDYGRRPRGLEPLPTQELTDAMESAGWLDLSNRRARMTVAGHDLEFVGMDDPHIERDRPDMIAGSAAEDAALTIGVVHAPYLRALDALATAGAELMLAGHTHGGQVCVPFYGALTTNCDLGPDRVKGVSRWWKGADNAPSSQAPDDAAWLHVSAGFGTSKFAPVRFACRPEATLLTLTPRA